MKILHVNKFAFPKGGAEVYMLETALRQQQRGDTVAVLGSAAESVGARYHGIYTIPYEVTDYRVLGPTGKFNEVKNVVSSTRARIALREAIERVRPDVVHLHNYAHQLSSSILEVVGSAGAQVVHTAHDYKLVCPAYVANVEGSDCFACATHLSPKLLARRCHHDSLAWSGVVALEAGFVRSGRRVPHVVIAPSLFMRDALTNSWLTRAAVRVELLRNPATTTGLRWRGDASALLYVGRLSREKGVDALIRASASVGRALTLAGDGPERLRLERLSAELGANVHFVGHVSGEELAVLRAGAVAQVVPSNWPENAPLSALEAGADGVPLIATRRGGVPELQGLGARVALVDELSAEALEGALHELDALPGDLNKFRAELSWDKHLDGLDRVYGASR